MAELGAGSGSGYPGALDTDSTLESSSTVARYQVPNDLADAIIKIQTELGTDPAGSLTDLVARLTVLLNDNGSAKNIAEGTFTARPASYTYGTFYFATDIEQMYYYSPGKSTWYVAF